MVYYIFIFVLVLLTSCMDNALEYGLPSNLESEVSVSSSLTKDSHRYFDLADASNEEGLDSKNLQSQVDELLLEFQELMETQTSFSDELKTAVEEYNNIVNLYNDESLTPENKLALLDQAVGYLTTAIRLMNSSDIQAHSEIAFHPVNINKPPSTPILKTHIRKRAPISRRLQAPPSPEIWAAGVRSPVSEISSSQNRILSLKRKPHRLSLRLEVPDDIFNIAQSPILQSAPVAANTLFDKTPSSHHGASKSVSEIHEPQGVSEEEEKVQQFEKLEGDQAPVEIRRRQKARELAGDTDNHEELAETKELDNEAIEVVQADEDESDHLPVFFGYFSLGDLISGFFGLLALLI